MYGFDADCCPRDVTMYLGCSFNLFGGFEPLIALFICWKVATDFCSLIFFLKIYFYCSSEWFAYNNDIVGVRYVLPGTWFMVVYRELYLGFRFLLETYSVSVMCYVNVSHGDTHLYVALCIILLKILSKIELGHIWFDYPTLGFNYEFIMSWSKWWIGIFFAYVESKLPCCPFLSHVNLMAMKLFAINPFPMGITLMEE